MVQQGAQSSLISSVVFVIALILFLAVLFEQREYDGIGVRDQVSVRQDVSPFPPQHFSARPFNLSTTMLMDALCMRLGMACQGPGGPGRWACHTRIEDSHTLSRCC